MSKDKQEREYEIDFEFHFSDTTILEADGQFSEVHRLMKYQEDPLTGRIVEYPDDWTVRSVLTIESELGIAKFDLSFIHTARVIINEYIPSIGDVFYNPDLAALSSWCQKNGWNVPEPALALVKSNVDFWKHYWETLLIDSGYLDEVFGARENLKPDYNPLEELRKDQEEDDAQNDYGD